MHHARNRAEPDESDALGVICRRTICLRSCPDDHLECRKAHPVIENHSTCRLRILAPCFDQEAEVPKGDIPGESIEPREPNWRAPAEDEYRRVVRKLQQLQKLFWAFDLTLAKHALERALALTLPRDVQNDVICNRPSRINLCVRNE